MIKHFNSIKVDMWLFIPLILISLFGLLILYSASNESISIIKSQSFKLFIGLLIMALISQINPNKIRVLSFKFYMLSVFLLILVEFFGITRLGATRWLNIGVLTIQPSELLKLSLPMMLGWLIYKKGMPKQFKSSILYSFLIIFPVLFVLKQPDLGTSILIVASGIYLLFQAGLSYYFIFYSLSIMVSSSPILWLALKDYQQQRILSSFNPELDPKGAGYHVIQSKTAISSGGLSGKGYLEGTQSHLGFIPEQKTDFIFAVLSEEFGFKGFLILFILYTIILCRLFTIIINTNDIYQKLVTGSIMMMFFSYVFVNVGMVSGLIPVVGVPLPLISFGGTSILSILVGFGIVSSFSCYKEKTTIKNLY